MSRRTFIFSLNKNKEEDIRILEAIESKDNMSKYVKDLIKKDYDKKKEKGKFENGLYNK